MTVREGWPDADQYEDGPWKAEPDRVEWRDAATGYPCLIARGPVGALCGYVAVPPGHPCHGKDYNEVDELRPDLQVHGGLTYAEACAGHICHVPAPGEPDNVWWLGFDCAHFGDSTPRRKAMARYYEESDICGLRSWESYKDIDYVRQEVTELAGQLASVAA